MHPLTKGAAFSAAVCALVLGHSTVRAVETVADLSELQLSGNALSPDFAREVSTYSATLPFTSAAPVLTGAPITPTASIRTRLNGAPSQVGLPLSLPLRTGVNQIALRIVSSGPALVDFPFSAGTNRNLALHPGGHVLQWGVGATNTPPSLPTAAQSAVSGVFSGLAGEYLLKSDGSLATLSGATPPAELTAGQAGVTQPRVVAVDVGQFIFVALRADGTVRIWGAFTNSSISGVSAVAAGNDHVLTLGANGRVSAWGDNNTFGQLNVPAAALSDVVAIAAYQYRNLALKSDGSLVQWGQVSTAQAAIPAAATDLVAIDLHANSNFGLVRSGAVIAWGNTSSSIDNPPPEAASGIVAIKTGPRHIVALKADGSLIAWGQNSSSQTAVSPSGFAPLFTPPLREYFVTATRATPSPALAGISLSAGTLTPVFAAETLAYSISVPYSTTSFTLAPSAVETATATISHSFNGARSQSTLPAVLPLRLGLNQVSLRVSAGGPPLGDFPLAAGSTRNLARSAAGGVMHFPVQSLSSSLTALPSESQSEVTGVFAGVYGEYALKTDGAILRLSGASVPLEIQPDSLAFPARAPIASLAIGQSHVLLLRTDGTTSSWGGNTAVNAIPADARSGIVAIASGANHVMALRADGRVVAWGSVSPSGYNETSVPPGCKADIVGIAAYGQRNLALRADGMVIIWGNYSYLYDPPPLSAQSGVVAIAAGEKVNLALKADGSVVAWGTETTTAYLQPPAAAAIGVVAIAAGPRHQLALKTNGTVISWGANANGTGTAVAPVFPATILDAPSRRYSLTIERRTPPAALAFLTTSAGAPTPEFAPETNTYALSNATFYPALALCGYPFVNQARLELRTGTEPFRAVTPGQSFDIGASGGAALRADGSVLAWGPYLASPPAATQSGVVSVAVGDSHAIALKYDGTLVGWGSNTYLEATPLAGIKATAIAAGRRFSVAILPWGSPALWGDVYGTPLASIPEDALDLVAVAAGDSHVLALRRDGRAIAWGASGPSAVPITAQSGVVAIASGPGYCMALRADGSVVSWGTTYAGLDVPPAAATYGVIAIAAGNAHALALKADGSVVIWGTNSGFYSPSNPIVQLTAVPAEIAGIAAGGSNSFALKRDGRIHLFNAAPSGAPAEFSTTEFALPLAMRLPLSIGSSTIELRASARDDTATRTYSIQATRNDAPVLNLYPNPPPYVFPQPDGTGLEKMGLQRVGVPSSPKSCTIINAGTADLILSSVDFTGSAAAEYGVSGMTLPLTLAPGAQSSFDIIATPASTGARSATLRLFANLPHGRPHSMPVTITGITLEAELATWRTAQFTAPVAADLAQETTVWGDLADPDADGVPNLLEYATNTNPLAPNVSPASLALDATTDPAVPRLSLTYTRRKNAAAAGLLYSVEWSDTLDAESWSTSGFTETITASTSVTETVNASIPANNSRRFLRLKTAKP
jgi:alpha-tubulin suppressor-like RCC1 family protein